MNRRHFLQLGGITGLSLFFGRGVLADEARYDGPVFLHFHAGGGWDPTLFCDAKPASTDSSTPLNQDSYGGVTDLNGIKIPSDPRGKYAKNGEYVWFPEGYLTTPATESPSRFFNSNEGKKFLVLNGIDTRTNSHETGTQFFGGGHISSEYPSIAAMVAARVAMDRELPMAYLAGGPYDITGDVIASSRFDRDRLANIAFPNRTDPNNSRSAFFAPAVQERIQRAKSERIASVVGAANLPRGQRSSGAMREALEGSTGLALLAEVFQSAAVSFDEISGILPFRDDEAMGFMRGGDRWVNFTRPLESLLRCFKAGASASATYSIPRGFDTHDSHDANQSASLSWLLLALRYTMARAETLGLANRLTVLVTSDFGRTPLYNTNNKGKDHWNVTSALVAGPGIAGNRGIGASDAGHKPMRVQLSNVSQVLPDADMSGIRIRPSHLHKELRRVFKVEEGDFAKRFRLPTGDGEDALPLFG